MPSQARRVSLPSVALLFTCLALSHPSALGQADPLDSQIDALTSQLSEAAKALEELRAEQAAKREAADAAIAADPNLAALQANFDARLAPLEDPLGASRPTLQSNLDIVWIMLAAILVLFMQAGFCLLEAGLSRAKNAANIAMKNALDFSAACLCFLLFGFALMFGGTPDSGGWAGGQGFLMRGFGAEDPIWAFWFFQAVFAATACTIASGAMAERTRFLGYVIYTALFAGLVYPIFGHWAWGSLAGGISGDFGGTEGWLEALGFHDFAGSTVVHGIGGACALAGIIIVGPRVDKFTKGGLPRQIPGHSLPLAYLGTFVLWVGWFGFNAGSTTSADPAIGRIAANTVIAGAAGSIAAMALFWALRGVPSIIITLNGILGGLVAVTACCDVIHPVSAVAVGAIAGVIATAGAIFLERLGFDDVVGAVPVHLFNGIWGTLCVALFHEGGFSIQSLGIQAFGTLAISMAAFIVALVMFKMIDSFVGLRATQEEQEDGLDFSEHSVTAYPDFKAAER